jgi:hypothetical protein
MKKLATKKEEDQIKALKLCANILSLDEISRMTGVRLELLRRFINRTANDARAETWDKVYPVIKPYLTGQEDVPAPKRIGPAYRRHAELVEMVSDQKVLLDAFNVLGAAKQKKAISILSKAAEGNWQASTFTSLNEAENQLMGAYLAVPQEQREALVLEITKIAIDEVKRIRSSRKDSDK